MKGRATSSNTSSDSVELLVLIFYLVDFLTIDDLSMIRWWVDASDRTHHDCKGHTGSMMSLEGGEVVSSSTKHKINTKSLTESELVALDDTLPLILWCLYFI